MITIPFDSIKCMSKYSIVLPGSNASVSANKNIEEF